MSDSGDYMNTLKALAAGDDRILFTDFVDGALRDELYSNAYLFVLPSDLEGMPLSLLEAMSYGNCVLVSDIEECTNVVHDRGITFRKGDVNDLEAKLRYAIPTQSGCSSGSPRITSATASSGTRSWMRP